MKYQIIAAVIFCGMLAWTASSITNQMKTVKDENNSHKEVFCESSDGRWKSIRVAKNVQMTREEICEASVALASNN